MAYYKVDLFFEDNDSLYVEASSKKEAKSEAELLSNGEGRLCSWRVQKVTKKDYEENK